MILTSLLILIDGHSNEAHPIQSRFVASKMPKSILKKQCQAKGKAVYVSASRPHTRMVGVPKSPDSRNIWPETSTHKLDALDPQTLTKVIQHGQSAISTVKSKLKVKTRGVAAQQMAAAATTDEATAKRGLNKYYSKKTTTTGPSTMVVHRDNVVHGVNGGSGPSTSAGSPPPTPPPRQRKHPHPKAFNGQIPLEEGYLYGYTPTPPKKKESKHNDKHPRAMPDISYIA